MSRSQVFSSIPNRLGCALQPIGSIVDDEVVAQALDHMREHVGNTIYVEEVARAAGVSRRVLEIRFRAVLYTSVYAEAQRLHFERRSSSCPSPDLP